MDEGKSCVKVLRLRMVGRGAGGRRQEVRIVCSVGGMVEWCGVWMVAIGKGAGRWLKTV